MNQGVPVAGRISPIAAESTSPFFCSDGFSAALVGGLLDPTGAPDGFSSSSSEGFSSSGFSSYSVASS